jgi:hypothetical protein
LPIAAKLAGLAKAIDYRHFSDAPRERVEWLIASFDVIANRLQEVERMPELLTTPAMERAVTEDLDKWRQGIVEVLRHSGTDPTQRLAALRRDLEAASTDLDQRMSAFVASEAAATLGSAERVGVLRLAGIHRGLAQALVAHAELLDGCDLRRWQEARF